MPTFRTMSTAVGDSRTPTLLHQVALVTKVVHVGDDVTVRYFTPKRATYPDNPSGNIKSLIWEQM